MKLTLSWLKTHLDTTASLDRIVETLTAIGLEVEDVKDQAQVFAPFRVALIEKAEKHPDADRLKICTINTGTETLQVVCGAPNARTGMKGVFAPAGSFIPGTGIELKKGVIRGQESNGMMVSEREMGLSDEHNGIIEVADDIALGTPMATLYGLDDPVIEINLTPNRSDCAGIRGIARDLAAAGLGTLKELDESAVKGSFASPVSVTLKFEKGTEDACPLFIGRYIKSVTNGASPEWLQKSLKAIGARSISALVDITNYMCLGLCRPLHVFDADKLQGPVHVRLARKGETLEALDGKIYELDDFMTVVCDDSGVIALAGIIGGAATGCTEATKNVYLEAAYFDPYRTARAGRALQINSDARYRFERGIDPAFTVPAAEIATRLILDLCGGTASEIVQQGIVPTWQRIVTFNPTYVNQLAGVDVDTKTQKTILQNLGFIVDDKKADSWSITPPSWRADIDGRADIVEEIVRIHGLDKLPALSLRPENPLSTIAETPSLALKRKARGVLAARGLDESITWSFLSSEHADLFGAQKYQTAAALRLVNPISSELSQMRPSILPNLILATARNAARGYPQGALFEVGPVFHSAKINGQLLAVSGIRSGAQGPRHWSGSQAHRPVDIYDVKADVMAVLEACGLPANNLQITRDVPEYFHPGRSGIIRLGANVIAHFGEIHPQTLESMDAKGIVCGFEVFLDRLPQPKKKAGPGKPLLKLSAFQPLNRDFAFIVDQTTDADTLTKAIRGVDKALITDVDIFDVYKGDKVESGKKSIAITVTLQPTAQTLTDTDIEALSQKIIAAVADKAGAKLRA